MLVMKVRYCGVVYNEYVSINYVDSKQMLCQKWLLRKQRWVGGLSNCKVIVDVNFQIVMWSTSGKITARKCYF